MGEVFTERVGRYTVHIDEEGLNIADDTYKHVDLTADEAWDIFTLIGRHVAKK